tara:strand:- start:961 stop:1671 length:711 start_codon:yes stop_codon:yes gene_type:complete
MFKRFLAFILAIIVLMINSYKVHALTDEDVKQFLERREQEWPSWNLISLKNSDIKKDLIYPIWFEGNWEIYSKDLNDLYAEPVKYSVRFKKNELGQIVGDRANNSESIGKAILGERLEKVKSDPNSFNNQIIYLKDNEFIESRVTARNQIFDEDIFFSDEFFIQSFHKSGVTRLNQVEMMSKFYKCNNKEIKSPQMVKPEICGFQYQATYGSKVGNKNVKAISTNKYELNFKFIGS